MIRIGIDVGGTNTDAVVMDGTKVVAGVKSATTADVMSGVVNALKDVLEASKVAASAVLRMVDIIVRVSSPVNGRLFPPSRGRLVFNVGPSPDVAVTSDSPIWSRLRGIMFATMSWKVSAWCWIFCPSRSIQILA